MTATYKMQLLAAVNQLKTTESYIETIEIKMIIDGKEVLSTYTTSYQKTGDAYTAAGLMESSNGINQKFYVVSGYMYMPVIVAEQPQNGEEQPPAWTQIGGIKIRLQEDFVSLVQFFAQNLGYLTPETVNGLSKESNIKTKLIEGQTVYTFKSKTTHNTETTESDYTVSVDAIDRITDIKQIIIIKESDGKTTTAVMNAAYDYVAVTIDLPDDLDTYPEYTG